MSDMTAYRSPDTDSKDTADQILVTKDDAEHTYARLALSVIQYYYGY